MTTRLIMTLLCTAIVTTCTDADSAGGAGIESSLAKRKMESLDRGLVAVHLGSGEVYIGWRMLGTDPPEIAFNVYRGSTRLNSSPITDSTNYIDNNGSTGSAYSIRAIVDGQEQSPSPAIPVWSNLYLTIPLQTPPGYTPNDASVGDLDGDGQYEIVIKQELNPKDNSHSGLTGQPKLEAYELDGTFLWRIDLGINIREGAHYTQFMVYDFDSDGKAEIACKTADGTRDGLGDVIGNPTADYRNAEGRIIDGPEFFTVFDGQTGRALATADYIVPRGNVCNWGDCYGNRVDRFLACVAYLDGLHPSIVMCRGYYTRSVLAAWDYRHGQLTSRWVFDSDDPGNGAYAGQGNHNLSVADVDGDGKDEIIYGGCVIDDDGTGLYSTGQGHGDAMHVTDMDPTRPGLEMWRCVETAVTGACLTNAATGEVIFEFEDATDVGRACAGDIDPRYLGCEMWASSGCPLYTCKGVELGDSKPAVNFMVWWDGDLLREVLDGTSIDKWNHSSSNTSRLLSAHIYGCAGNNGTKATPALQADILGDWREEVIWRTSDNRSLRLFTTTIPTSHRFYTFMHDPVYRLGIAWQNVAYNQPPHVGYYMGDGMTGQPPANIRLVEPNPLSVSVSLPEHDSTFVPGDDVLIKADAADGNGQVALVEFYQGQTKLAEDAKALYTCIWRDVPEGIHTLTARATDDDDLTAGSTPVTMYVRSPRMTIQENRKGFCQVDGRVDTDHAGFTYPGYVNTTNVLGAGIDWNVLALSDVPCTMIVRYANGALDRSARLMVDGDTVVEDINFPGTGAWTSWDTLSANVILTPGIKDIRLEATNAEGLPNVDYLRIEGPGLEPLYCTGNNPPIVAMIAPENAAELFAGADVTLEAQALDVDGAITAVGFYQNQILLGEDTAPPYAYAWRDVEAGVYGLTAKAYDNDGAEELSAIIAIHVKRYGDFSGDDEVGADDLTQMSAFWLQTNCAEIQEFDLNDDCTINLYEFSSLAANWLMTI